MRYERECDESEMWCGRCDDKIHFVHSNVFMLGRKLNFYDRYPLESRLSSPPQSRDNNNDLSEDFWLSVHVNYFTFAAFGVSTRLAKKK